MCERDQKPETVAKPGVQIVQLTPDSWEILRDIKIRSTTQEPIAFEDQEPGLARYQARTESEWRAKLDEEASRTVSLFAQSGSETVGMVSGVMTPSMESAVVQHMYVDPEHRGRKIGGKLLDTLLFELRERGVKTAILQVVVGQDSAIGLYISRSFKEIGRGKATRGNDTVSELIMAKRL